MDLKDLFTKAAIKDYDKFFEEFKEVFIKRDDVVKKIDSKIKYWEDWKETHADDFCKLEITRYIELFKELRRTIAMTNPKPGYKTGDIIFFEPNNWIYHGYVGSGVPSNKGFKILKISEKAVMLEDPEDDMRPITVTIKMFDDNCIRKVIRNDKSRNDNGTQPE